MNINIDVNKACAFTGHRELEKNFDKSVLINKINLLIEKGFNTFLVGMAVGFDSLCFKILEKIRKEKDIKIIACIPCENQEKNFSFLQKLEYKKMLASADEKIMVSTTYTPYCMQKRNMFMVDNSSVLIAYLKQEKGGTANTVNYAKKAQKPIIYV